MNRRILIPKPDVTGEIFVDKPGYIDQKEIKFRKIKRSIINPIERNAKYPDFLQTKETPTSLFYDRKTLKPEPIKEPNVIGIENQC